MYLIALDQRYTELNKINYFAKYSNTNLDLEFYTTICDRVKFSELIFIDKTYYDA